MCLFYRYFSFLFFISLYFYGKALGQSRTQIFQPPFSVTLNYKTVPTLFLVNPSIQWEIDKNASNGYGVFFTITDKKGNNVTESNGEVDYQVLPKIAVNTKTTGKLVIKNKKDGSTDELMIALNPPELKLFEIQQPGNRQKPIVYNPVSTLHSFLFYEKENPSIWTQEASHFIRLATSVTGNITWRGKLTFHPRVEPWVLFSTTRSISIPNIDRDPVPVDMLIQSINYKNTPDTAIVTYTMVAPRWLTTPVSDSIVYQIIRYPISLKLTGVSPSDKGFGFIKSTLHGNVDTVRVPCFASTGMLQLEAPNMHWGVFNEVTLRQNLGVEIKPQEDRPGMNTGNNPAIITVSKNNYSRKNLQVPLIFYHTRGVVFNPPNTWELAILQQPGCYLETQRDTVFINNPLPFSNAAVIAVKSNVKWKITLKDLNTGRTPTWLTIPAGTMPFMGNAELAVSITQANCMNEDKKAEITIEAMNAPGLKRKVVIIQKAPLLRIVAPKQVVFPSVSTVPIAVQVESNLPWRAMILSTALWAKITDITNEGFNVIAENNTSGNIRFTGIALASENCVSLSTEIKNNQYVKQVPDPITLLIEPYPRMAFMKEKGQEQFLKIITEGGWIVEKLPGQNYDWLEFPSELSGVGISGLPIRTVMDNETNHIKSAVIVVKSQISNIAPQYLEILQTTDFNVMINTLVKDKLRVTFSHFVSGFTGHIYNEFGVFSQKLNFTENGALMDVSTIPTGNYLIYFYDTKSQLIAVKKFVKM